MAEERRRVVVDEPGLSDETNEALTEEVRGAVGSDEVRVPQDRGHAHAPRRRSSLAASLSANRLIIIITLLTVIVVGAIVALATGSWWWLVVPIVVHAIATFVLAGGILHATTQVERPDPTTVARMEEEGVPDPEGTFNQMVQEYGGSDPDRRETAEVVKPGHNERTVGAQEEPGRAASEHRTAITPSSHAEPSGGESSAIAFLPWYVVGALAVASIVFAIVLGGSMWIAPAVVIPLGIGWIVVDRLMHRRTG